MSVDLFSFLEHTILHPQISVTENIFAKQNPQKTDKEFNYLDFTMLQKIETKTNLIGALFYKKRLARLLFDKANILGWLFTLKKKNKHTKKTHKQTTIFHRIKKNVILIVF